MALHRKQQERDGRWTVVRNADNVALYACSNEYNADRYLNRARAAQAYETRRKNARERLKGFLEQEQMRLIRRTGKY